MNNFKIDVKTCKYLPSGEIRKVLVQYIPKDFCLKVTTGVFDLFQL